MHVSFAYAHEQLQQILATRIFHTAPAKVPFWSWLWQRVVNWFSGSGGKSHVALAVFGLAVAAMLIVAGFIWLVVRYRSGRNPSLRIAHLDEAPVKLQRRAEQAFASGDYEGMLHDLIELYLKRAARHDWVRYVAYKTLRAYEKELHVRADVAFAQAFARLAHVAESVFFAGKVLTEAQARAVLEEALLPEVQAV